MQQHFNISNITKNMTVTDSSWNNYPCCNCHEVMHRYHWDKTDLIYSSDGISNLYIFVHDNRRNVMLIEEMYKYFYIRSYQELPVYKYQNKNPIKVGFNWEIEGNTGHSIDPLLQLTDISLENFEKIIQSRPKINSTNSNPRSSHAPLWYNDRCVLCNYQYQPNNIKTDIPNFNQKFLNEIIYH